MDLLEPKRRATATDVLRTPNDGHTDSHRGAGWRNSPIADGSPDTDAGGRELL
jgi:hypothetical protein